MMRQQLYPKHIIKQMLQSNITATINMAGLDIDPDIIRARLGVVYELAELFGLTDQLKIPSVAITLLKAKGCRVLDSIVR